MSRKLFCLMSIVFVLGMASTSLARLEGYWPLDGDTLDASGNGRHGTLMGDADWVADPNKYVAGAVGQAIFFDGKGYVNIDGYKGISAIDGSQQAFAISNWFKTTGDGEMVTWGTSAGRTRLTWRIQGNRLRTEHGAGNLRGSKFVDDNEWHHCVLAVSEGANLRPANTQLYIDGAEETYRSGSNNPYELGAGADVSIGRRADNDSRYFPGTIDEVYIFSRPLSDEQVADIMNGVLPQWPKADKPSPADGDMLEEESVFLSWRPGTTAVSHDVYFGTTPDLGADQLASQQDTSEYLATGLVPDQTYYWRVDEVDANGVVATGDVYSFWTPPKSSFAPSPADGARILGDTATLTWSGGWGPIMHNVHFGTDPAALVPVSMMQVDATYDPGPLEPDKTYYWRIDEFYGVDTVTGPVWSLSTVPVLPASDDPNLVAQWTFDGDFGGVALDQSGNGNHAALRNGGQVVAGRGGDVLDLGENGYAAISNIFYETTGIPEITVGAWIRTDVETDQYIASFDRNEYWRLEINGSGAGDGQVGWDLLSSDGQLDYGSVTRVDDAEWHQVTGVFDNGIATIYIDGFAEPSATTGATFGTGTLRYGLIGANSEASSFDGSNSGGPPIAGEIDDLTIYDRAFTEDELRQLYGNLQMAWQPQPELEATVEIVGTSLSWAPGDGATEHLVFLGTDPNAVADADVLDTTGIYRGFQSEASYVVPETLDFETDYYWRVDERSLVEGSVVLTKGRIWSFSTGPELVIYDTETPFDYDTSVDPFVSEISLDLDPAIDMTDPIGRVSVSYTGNAAAGSVTVDEAAGTTTIVGRGADIWGTSDEFQYAYTTLTGDGSMTVKVDSLAHTDNWSKAGIMIRETLDAGSSFAAVFATGVNGVRFQARAMADQSATADDAVATDEAKALVAPVWIKIERMFPMINAYYSTDGVTFTPMSWNPQVIPMTPAPIHIGLAVTSHSGAETYAEAVFSELSFDGGVAPGPLTSAEIGLTGNSAAPMYLVLEDASGAAAAVLNPDPDATLQASATDFVVDLRDVGIDLSAVTRISLVIGDLDAPAPGGSGSLTINNVRLLSKQPLIIWVDGDYDDNGDGAVDDLEWVGILEAEGYAVDNSESYVELDDAKIATLEAADLIIVSRNSNSGDYDDGEEPVQWNAITTPILLSSTHIVRSSRWKWVDSTSILNLAPAVMEMADGTAVAAMDEAVGPSSFIDAVVGNGTVLATGDGLPWIFEFETGVEYYDGAGQTAGGPRMFFTAGTQESDEPNVGRGEMNLTAEGLAIFLDAVSGLIAD